jgi:choline-sulfatase
MAADRPNILLIMCDQMTPLLTGAYDHPVVQTPSLDRLVRRGVRFDAAYTPVPICAPARACMLSGRYGSEISIYDNATPLRCDQVCWTHYLTLAGYDTVLCGKMHLVGPDQLHGYRARLTRNIYPADFTWTPERDYAGKVFARQLVSPADWLLVGGYIEGAFEVGKWHKDLAFDEQVQLRARQYLCFQAEQEPAGRQPFCLTVSYHHPHEPFHAPQDCWDLYEGVEIPIPQYPEGFEERFTQMDRWTFQFNGCDQRREELRRPENLRRLRRAYYAMVSYADRMIGELLDLLERRGLAERTIVVFTSDHGDMLGDHGLVQKRTFYENSARVPLIIAMPDGLGAGRKVKAPVNLIDLMPTLCEMAGVPAEGLAPHDGRSLMPYVRGEEAGEGAHTFAEQHTDGTYVPCFMVRKGRFKYVYVHGYEGALYDLEDDPGEWSNLVRDPDHAGVVDELRGLILARFDPGEVDRDLRRSITHRRIIQRALVRNGTSWAAMPVFSKHRDPATQYAPGGVE